MMGGSGGDIYPGTGFQKKLKPDPGLRGKRAVTTPGPAVTVPDREHFVVSRQTRIMATARCCPADCALRSDWEDELRAEKEQLDAPSVAALLECMKLLGHPLRLKILLMLLNRDHCVCEFYYVFEEPRNLISYNLKKLRDGGLIGSYYRSNHKIYRMNEAMVPVIRKIAAAVPG
jgi:DNA-binding transcriptional ArsR family regulator